MNKGSQETLTFPQTTLKNVLCQEMEQQQQLGRENVYRDHLIPEGPVTFPMGNCPSLDSLNCEYQMAALGWSEAR